MTVFEVALSDVAGEATFCHVIDDAGLSGFRPTVMVTADMPTNALRVRTACLDDLIPVTNPIALIKIDVEGAEHAAFRGARELLGRDHPVIIFECGAGAADKYVDDPATKIFDLLGELGFSISLMARWLNDELAFTREQFEEQFRTETNYYFIAYPAHAGLT